MIHLRTVQLNSKKWPKLAIYPFDLPSLQGMEELKLESEVTFFVGENGTGKSTLLAGIAAAVGAVTVGGQPVATDPQLTQARHLGEHLKLAWSKRTNKGFYMRSEDFINFGQRMAELRSELEEGMAEAEDRYANRPYAKQLAQMPLQGSLAGLQRSYGDGPLARSHGEGFFDLFQARLTKNGLYLLDEPETPLSPIKQIAFLSLLHEKCLQGCQFVIATHSPILLSYPTASILSFDEKPVSAVRYEDLEHVKVTREFLNHPSAFLRHLF